MLRTRAPLVVANPFDLHVLGPPQTFALSQDQTLQFESARRIRRSGNRPCPSGPASGCESLRSSLSHKRSCKTLIGVSLSASSSSLQFSGNELDWVVSALDTGAALRRAARPRRGEAGCTFGRAESQERSQKIRRGPFRGLWRPPGGRFRVSGGPSRPPSTPSTLNFFPSPTRPSEEISRPDGRSGVKTPARPPAGPAASWCRPPASRRRGRGAPSPRSVRSPARSPASGDDGRLGCRPAPTR